MKKILSIALVLCMVFAMAITANAATTGSMTFTASADEVTVGDEFTVTIKYIPGADSCFKGGTIKLEWNYADGVASIVEEVEGMTDFTSNTINFKPANNIYTIKHAATADDAWQELTSEGVFSVVKFKAEKAGTFTLNGGSAAVTFADAGNLDRLSYKGTSITPITVTVKDAAPADTTVYDAAIACEKTWTAVKNANTSNTNEYTNVAVATAECPATATEAGFKFAKDSETPNDTAEKWVVPFDATVLNGAGNVEYTAVMYGVDYAEVTTVYAIPYYVPAN